MSWFGLLLLFELISNSYPNALGTSVIDYQLVSFLLQPQKKIKSQIVPVTRTPHCGILENPAGCIHFLSSFFLKKKFFNFIFQFLLFSLLLYPREANTH